MLSLWWYQRKAEKALALPRIGASARLSELWRQMDPVGLILFTASLVMVLLPMTLVNRFLQSWSSPATISMIVVGVCCFVAFIAYEIRVARFPILSLQLVGNRTVAAGCLIESFVFLSFYLWQPYYYSFLVVVADQSAKAATNIVIAQGVATAGTGLLTALVVKWTGNCKWVILAGSAIKLIGAGLMLRYSNSQASVTQILFGQLVSGMGTGMISIVAQTIVQAVARHQGEQERLGLRPSVLGFVKFVVGEMLIHNQMLHPSPPCTKPLAPSAAPSATPFPAPSGPTFSSRGCKNTYLLQHSRRLS
jgi:hypothetical protein